MKTLGNLAILIMCIAVVGCSSDKHKNLPPTYIIYSPNAEPLNGGPFGHPTCTQALSNWFMRMDVNHSGNITHEQFITDAKLQFARMDIDKNSYLMPEELERYRAPYRQESSELQEHKGHGKNTDKAPAINPKNLIDPVMSADTNLDFKVTFEEFMAQAEKNFAELDTDHNGLLSQPEILAKCTPVEK